MVTIALSTRDRLVRAGVHFFQTQGYHGTGISQILGRAKAPKGCFYHHFPGGKEQLAIAALAWLEIGVARYFTELEASGASAREMVQGLARFTVEGLTRWNRGSLYTALAQDIASDSPAIAAALRGAERAICVPIANAYGKGGERFAEQALAIVQGASILARAAGRPERTIEIVDEWLTPKEGRHG